MLKIFPSFFFLMVILSFYIRFYLFTNLSGCSCCLQNYFAERTTAPPTTTTTTTTMAMAMAMATATAVVAATV